jgi:hypothetical protein
VRPALDTTDLILGTKEPEEMEFSDLYTSADLIPADLLESIENESNEEEDVSEEEIVILRDRLEFDDTMEITMSNM